MSHIWLPTPLLVILSVSIYPLSWKYALRLKAFFFGLSVNGNQKKPDGSLHQLFAITWYFTNIYYVSGLLIIRHMLINDIFIL